MKLLKLFLFSLVILFPAISSAAVGDDEWWKNREIQLQQNREDYARRVYGRSAKSFLENDPVTGKSRTITKRVVVEDIPTASKVGNPMFKRVAHYAKNPGIQMVGVMAVTQLIEAIGWVMKDGAYVKTELKEPDNNTPKCYNYGSSNGCYSDGLVGCKATFPTKFGHSFGQHPTAPTASICNYYNTQSDFNNSINKVGLTVWYVDNPNYDPNADKEIIDHPLTPALLGAAMMGEGYSDPVDSSKNAAVNTGQMHPSVADAYQHDSTGIGDELANQIDDKIKNAPPTPDGQPAPSGDARYSTPPTEQTPNANDRSWTEDTGTATGSTSSTSTTDPATGQTTTTGSTSFQFPPFCEWAFTVCEWMGWTKDETGLPQRDITDLNVTQDFQEQSVSLSWAAQCPAPTYETVSLHGVTAQVKVTDFTYICQLDWLIKPFVLGFASISSLFILFGFQRSGSDD